MVKYFQEAQTKQLSLKSLKSSINWDKWQKYLSPKFLFRLFLRFYSKYLQHKPLLCKTATLLDWIRIFSGPRNKCLPARFKPLRHSAFWQRALISIGLKQASAHTFDPISMKGPYTPKRHQKLFFLTVWGLGRNSF